MSTIHRDVIFIPLKDARTSFIDVRDIGAVAALALTSPGHENQAYDLTGPEALDYHQTANLFTMTLGRRIPYKNLPASPSSSGSLRGRSRSCPPPVGAWLHSKTKSGMAELVTAEQEKLLGREAATLSHSSKAARTAEHNSRNDSASPRAFAPSSRLLAA